MSLSLESVFSDEINLYDELEISVSESPEQIPSSLIKKQYRKLALLYHPDKRPDDPDAIHRFHMLSLATHVLTDESLRVTYDQWLQRTLLDRNTMDLQRSELISKLNKLESKAQKRDTDEQARNLTRIQEYGTMLRKMKHFKIPYGDWTSVNPYSPVPEHKIDRHSLYDSSTLRLELRNDLLGTDLSDEKALCETLVNLFKVQRIYDLYYSSRNDFKHDKAIVAYAVFETTEESRRIYQAWKSASKMTGWEFILDVSPRIPVTYYKNYDQKVELNSKIEKLVNDSTIVID